MGKSINFLKFELFIYKDNLYIFLIKCSWILIYLI